MSQEPVADTAQPPQPPRRRSGLAAARAFFDLPNPEMFKIFLIGSFATFSSGIAFAVEWTLHGRHHPGFRWIVFYASSLISLPVLIWLGLGVHIAFSGSTQTPDSAKHEERDATEEHVTADRSPQASDQTEKNNTCRSLAVVVASDESNKKSIEV